jgi:molybdenum cofactor synthesis domain-containing protein
LTPETTSSAPWRACVLTVSDRAAAGVREDASGPALLARLEELGFASGPIELVPDGEDAVAAALRRLCDEEDFALVLTTGGSGLGPRDRTPEATRLIADREVPGLMELARRRCTEITETAALGRGLAVTRHRTLILNLPGHPRAARETLDAVAALLFHALAILRTPTADCARTGRGRGGSR